MFVRKTLLSSKKGRRCFVEYRWSAKKLACFLLLVNTSAALSLCCLSTAAKIKSYSINKGSKWYRKTTVALYFGLSKERLLSFNLIFEVWLCQGQAEEVTNKTSRWFCSAKAVWAKRPAWSDTSRTNSTTGMWRHCRYCLARVTFWCDVFWNWWVRL